MQESKETNKQSEEKLIDIKGTLKQFVVADEPELSQEEAIMKYGETKKKRKINNADSDETDTTEEEEHLKRIKQELLESLKRVEKLEELLFKNREEKIKLNVKSSKNGGFTSAKSLNEKESQTKKQKERE